MKRKKKARISLDQSTVMPVIHDGLIAGPDLGGDPIAVVVVDASARLDVREAVKISKFTKPGDAETAWGQINGLLVLHVKLIRPVPAEIVIPFPLPEKGAVVDLIYRSQAFYLQPGEPGDKLGYDLSTIRLLIQVDSAGLAEQWPALYIKSAINVYRKQGLGPLEARKAADESYERISKAQDFRIRARAQNRSSDQA